MYAQNFCGVIFYNVTSCQTFELLKGGEKNIFLQSLYTEENHCVGRTALYYLRNSALHEQNVRIKELNNRGNIAMD
jgi:hypothetical protein